MASTPSPESMEDFNGEDIEDFEGGPYPDAEKATEAPEPAERES